MFIFYRGLPWKEQDNRMSRMAFHTNCIKKLQKFQTDDESLEFVEGIIILATTSTANASSL